MCSIPSTPHISFLKPIEVYGRPQPQLQNSAHLMARSSTVCPQFPLSWSGASPSFPANHHTPILQKGLHETPPSPFFEWFNFCLLNRSEHSIISFFVFHLPSLVSGHPSHPSALKQAQSTPANPLIRMVDDSFANSTPLTNIGRFLCLRPVLWTTTNEL